MNHEQQQKHLEMLSDHAIETKRKKADVYNLGMEIGAEYVRSKTSIGVLHTQIKNGEIEHTWEVSRQ